MKIELEEDTHKPDELVSITKQLFEIYGIEFFKYKRNLTYCRNCKRSWVQVLHKCPSCGATGTLTVLKEFSSF